MTTKEAIQYAKENQGQHVRLLALNNTYIYTKDGIDFSLIIHGAFKLGFAEIHHKEVEQDLEYYKCGINWLKNITPSNTGTTVTYERAIKRYDKILRSHLSH